MNSESISKNTSIAGRIIYLAFLMITVGMFLTSNTANAHKPDRCFHTHNGGNTKCKSRVRGKACSDANGNKGRCVQTSRYCYCKINKTKRPKIQLDLNIGIGLGGRKHRRSERHKNKTYSD